MFNCFMRIVNAVVIIFLMSKSYGSTIESSNDFFIDSQITEVDQQLYTCAEVKCFSYVIEKLNKLLIGTKNHELESKIRKIRRLAFLKWEAGMQSGFDLNVIRNTKLDENDNLTDYVILKELEGLQLQLNVCSSDDCFGTVIRSLNNLLLKTRNKDIELKIRNLRSSGFKQWEELVKFKISHGVEK